jgi:tetratricopeptide (TPR) repeat protein
VKSHRIVRLAALAAALGLLPAGLAHARNPHCAGGIQYLSQAMNDKSKGNTEDYVREINKAVQQLEICAKEDPKDYEAIGYLGWAYAEVESMGPAGVAFDAAIKGLETKGDKKKIEMVVNNRKSYWLQAYNAGIGKIQDAQKAYPEFCNAPANAADSALRLEAQKSYQEATVALTRAQLLMSGDAQTFRNLASIHALQCDYASAETVLRKGIEVAPSDTSLQDLLKRVRASRAARMADEKNFDEAIASLTEILKTEPNNPDHHLSLGEVYYRRAEAAKGDAQKKDFETAGDAYAKAATFKPNDPDLAYNAGVAYQNAQSWTKAEAQWSKAVKLRPEDSGALSSWGTTLVELKRCPEAIQAVHKAVDLKPQEKNLHRQLGAIYTKCGNNARGTDELMIFLAMQNGQPAADAAAQAKQAKQGSDAAKTLASEGVPEQIYQWTADNQQFETWFYWSKKRAFAFNSGTLSRKSDWSAADTKTTTVGAGKP